MKNRWITSILGLALVAMLQSCSASKLPSISEKLEDLKVSTKGDRLIVENSEIKRVWRLTEYGLVTESITNQTTGKQWSSSSASTVCDWSYYGLVDNTTEGELLSLNVTVSTDEGFTAEHLAIVAEVEYAATQSTIQYNIWAYPNVPGIRTQAFIKSGGAVAATGDDASSSDAPYIELSKGKNQKNTSAAERIDPWYASVSSNAKAVELRACNLDPDKEYMVGGSLWDEKTKQWSQQVRITSIDGEASQIVVSAADLSASSGDDGAPATFLAKIPNGLNMDGTVRIFIDNTDDKTATISEIWLMELGGKSTTSTLTGEQSRINEIAGGAAKGYGLVAYYDCGTVINRKQMQATGYSDFLPIEMNRYDRRYMGYFNDTQNRNKWSTPIYREATFEANSADIERINWANIMSIESGDEGVMIVKESHKCVNQYGVDTGDFEFRDGGVVNSGTSLTPKEISADIYKWFWGSWTVVYDGADDGRELALKEFDRARFPINLERDMYSVMCTWGHSKDQRDGRNYATEAEVLKELDFVAECGIDMLLIDDGWQVSLESTGANPDGGRGWKPYPKNYPQDWANVVAKSDELGLKLGLWGVAQQMPSSDMVWNWERLKMNQLKLDFASFGTNEKLSTMISTVRQFMLKVNHQSSISWDLTENAARYGYYWAREYGNLHFMNRKPFMPLSVLYVPSLSLRDFWLLSKYNNLNKYQLVIQNPEVCDKSSDAHLHSPQYCAATALMGVPEFMAVTRFYSEQARADIRELMDVYKEAQEDIFTGYAFPIGQEPSNRSWTGFQLYHPDRNWGYVTIFRELENTEVRGEMNLRFFKGAKVRFTDMMTGEVIECTLDKEGRFSVEAAAPASYKFWRYEVL